MQMTCACGKQLTVADHRAGQRVRCPQCGEFLQMLELAEDPPPRGRTRRRPSKTSPLVIAIGLGSGAVLVAGVTVGVMLLVMGKRPPDAATGPSFMGPLNSLTSTYNYPPGMYTEKNVHQLAYSGDGKFLATVSADSTPTGLQQFIKVWNLAAGNIAAQFSNDINAVSTLAFSPNGKLLAVGGSGRVQLWDLEKKVLRHKDEADAGVPKLGE